ncbi:SH3 domain-containing protein [Anaerobacterium chartisolvens]|uniref:SH3 domain-containing protein n=1 Tax=Anaerobacterium chartisolvens TaxID=1297424 RepID=A0A369BDW8_9FIRM|nr:SH3 domain-containing protein [Anaerobacterium chartisolvens]RCX17864.1 SH3 domain-containing protein [Anaerobacterium chartisolvens]
MKLPRHMILIFPLTLLLIVSIGFNIILAASDGAAEPGSDQDPLVSKSYVDASIEQYKKKVEELKKQVEELKSGGAGTAAQGFESVSIDAGKIVYTGAGTEIVMRSGKAVSVKGQNGGLCDTTSAKDLDNGQALEYNHLVISARDDGRGFKVTGQCWVLIRGGYKVEDAPVEKVEKPVETVTQKGIVNASSLNIRAEKSTSAQIVGSLVKGDSVTVLSKSGEWYNIKTANGVSGWVMGKYITMQQQ